MDLNAQQQACVDAIDGIWVVIASAGTGKTTVLTQRHLNMLMKGISSRDILNLTFTSAAAEAMVRKVGLLDADEVFRTFHSFCLDLLKKEREHLPFKTCDTIIPVQLEDYELLFKLVKRYPAVKNFKSLRQYITDKKCDNIEPAEAIELSTPQEYMYALGYRDYEKECREQGWLDFDSLMRETLILLQSNEAVRNRWKRKYISVDECQDTDVVQFKILQQIFDGNIFVVGDENQLIYEWRSAQAGNLSSFSKKFPNAERLFLGQNYRSTKALVRFFKKILPVDNGIAEHMTTENEEGVDPVMKRYADPVDEIYWVLGQITDPTNSAILARTNRQLFEFQRVCTMRNIKYKILGKRDFWEQNEVKKLLQFAKNSPHMSRQASEVLTDLVRQHRMIELYQNSVTIDSNPVENINNVVRMAANKTLGEFLEWVRKRTHGRKSEKGLTLSTVHQAKGREWENVFVVGVEQGKMPHQEGDLAEEERIFFVACTRAAKFLHISYSGSRSMFLNDFRDQIIDCSGEDNGESTDV